MINICIVDDHPTILEGIKNIFSKLPDVNVVATFESPILFLKTYENKSLPDIILLDIQMSEKTGDKVLLSILKKHPNAKVIAFSNFDSPYYVKRMMDLGTKGYLIKSSTKSEMLEAIFSVYKGQT